MKLNIGENIRRLRRSADMTQEQLADKLGVAYQSVSRWENGTTYPDMELLPVLAGIFGVTVDELLGMEESKKKEHIEARVKEYGALCVGGDVEKAVNLLRELRRDCMANAALSEYMLQLFSYVKWVGSTIKNRAELLAELRITAKEIMEGNFERWLKDAVVEQMSHIEEDEHIEAFLDKYATERDLTKDTLLYDRYRWYEEWDKADVLRQKRLLSIIHTEFFNNGLWRSGNRPNDAYECLQTNTMLVNFIHNLCGVTPAPDHPITGDGSVDLFLEERIDLGIRRACYLAAMGDPEGNESLEVQQINNAALDIMNIRSANDILGDQVIRILDPTSFINVLHTGRNIRNERVYLAEYRRYVEQTIVHDMDSRLLICLMRDVTDVELDRKKKEQLNRHTVEVANKVVDKQMRIVQEIASLLGETAAETKIALTKLKESITDE